MMNYSLSSVSAYCSILKLMKQSHHLPANAKYAELSDIAKTLTSIHQSRHQICKNRLFLIQPFQKLFAPHTLITPHLSWFFADKTITQLVFALATTWFCTSPLGSSSLSY